MPEILLVLFIIVLICSPQVLAYYFAKHLGRDAKFWFWISFIIPIISLFILIFLPDIKEAEDTSLDNKAV